MKTNHPTSVNDTSDDAQAERLAVKARHKMEAAHDAGLVQRFKAGDESAFTEIIQRHFSRLSALANRILRNQADAEEVAQDALIRAHRNLANFRGDCSLAAWLHCIALNLARNRYWFHFRRHRHHAVSLSLPFAEGSNRSLEDALADETATPRAESMTSEFVTLVAECMERLEDSHREILTMRTVLNLTYEQIASSLRVNVGTVKSRIARARERLRELLHQAAPEISPASEPSDFFELERPLPAHGLAMG